MEMIRATACEIAQSRSTTESFFDVEGATAEVIRDEEAYTGVRVSMTPRSRPRAGACVST